MIRVLPLVLCGVLAAFAAATRGWRHAAPPPSPDVVARVGDRVLTSAEADRLAEELLPDETVGVPGLPAQAARREEAIRAWVCEELLYQEGLRRGAHLDDPVVRRRVADRVYEEDVASLSVAEPVGPAEARAYYDGHAAEFARPVQVTGIHVVLGFPDGWLPSEREARWEEVAAVAGGDLAALERTLTACEASGVHVRVAAAMDRAQTEELVARGFSRRVSQAYFSEEASRAAVIVEAEDGVHVLRALGRTTPDPVPFEECRVQVEDAVRRARSDVRYQALLRGLASRPDVVVPGGLLGE